MQLIDGKKISAEIQDNIAKEVKQMIASGKKQPHLAAVLVGNDGGSETYVASKIKACENVGFKSTLIRHSDDVSEEKLLQTVYDLNDNDDIDGFIVQLPLPRHINEHKIIEAIDPKKDVDGFHPINVGRMVLNLPCYVSATPYGIVQLLEKYNIETSGKHCVVIGRSHIVGSPMSILMAKNTSLGNCTVTLCHSKTKDLKSFTQKADSAFAFACNSHGILSVALDVTISYTHPAKVGEVLTVEAKELNLTNRTGLYDIITTNEKNELVCVFKGTSYRTGKDFLAM